MTGFGLGGHGTEMADGSKKTLVIDAKALPILPDVEEYASMGLIREAHIATGNLQQNLVT